MLRKQPCSFLFFPSTCATATYGLYTSYNTVHSVLHRPIALHAWVDDGFTQFHLSAYLSVAGVENRVKRLGKCQWLHAWRAGGATCKSTT